MIHQRIITDLEKKAKLAIEKTKETSAIIVRMTGYPKGISGSNIEVNLFHKKVL